MATIKTTVITIIISFFCWWQCSCLCF